MKKQMKLNHIENTLNIYLLISGINNRKKKKKNFNGHYYFINNFNY